MNCTRCGNDHAEKGSYCVECKDYIRGKSREHDPMNNTLNTILRKQLGEDGVFPNGAKVASVKDKYYIGRLINGIPMGEFKVKFRQAWNFTHNTEKARVTKVRKAAPLSELRKKAMEDATPYITPVIRVGEIINRPSAPSIRVYIVARANGACEMECGTVLGYTDDGEILLNLHHIIDRSKGGPDDPRYTAGVCGTCHDRLTRGSDRVELNAQLLAKVAAKEETAAQ
jgi:hypothetical protein